MIYFFSIYLRKFTIFPILYLLLAIFHHQSVQLRFIIIIFSSFLFINIPPNSRLIFFLLQKTPKRFSFFRNPSIFYLFCIAIHTLIWPNSRALRIMWVLDIIMDFIAQLPIYVFEDLNKKFHELLWFFLQIFL